ncbi:FecR family protein [uncultured Chitinophaga sp.]|uniref:FecR family protein n=1 Tax=uncultured Chitinophaga sp. TaxID=339340 RepID=UPI0025DC72DE|nr:FecR family protein [uncultured Chitinophaga sp.]
MQPTLEDLLAKYLANELTEQECDALYGFLRSPVHQGELEQLIDAGFRDDVFTGLSDRSRGDILFGRIMETAQPKVRRMQWWKYAAAAAVIIGLATGIYHWSSLNSNRQPDVAAVVKPGSSKALLTLADGSVVELDSAGRRVIGKGVRQQNGQLVYDHSMETGYNTLTVPRGGQFEVTLPDGSHAWLNSASSLRYPVAFNGKERVVELQGQGYFEITKDQNQPFKVLVNDVAVDVLGTSFDIMAYANEHQVSTTLVTGAVRVSRGGVFTLLRPGRQAVFTASAAQAQVQEADVEQVTAWTTGFFEFTDTELPVIMRQLERWYDVEVVYKDAPLKERFFGRTSRSLPVTEVLKMLEGDKIKFKLEGRTLTVMPR